ncbi:MFS transporter [Bacillus sp. AGMB 02131]|uniref:MFS transporter n=1 Tax=Peribacillus faecalis TaxID=2772559 RepID=A0A927CWA7_9BACI|nr:MFS transporter [Peribacillus faecalis]MBD3107937.1 MFS transporter [Peribacillus faecalis]
MFFRHVPAQLIPRAQSVSSTVQVASGLLAPAIAGVLLAISLQLGFLFQAAAFFISIIFISFIKQKELTEKVHEERLNKTVFMKDLKEGFRTIMKEPILRGLIFYLVLINFIFAPVEILLPIYAKSAAELAAIEIAFFIGIFLGSIVINFMLRLPKIVPIISGLVCMFAGFALLSFSGNFVLSCLLIAIVGIGSPLVNISLSSLFMVKVPREVIGRSQSTVNVLLESVSPVALMLTGFILVVLNVQQMFLAIAAAGAIIVLLMVLNPVIRKAN